MITPRLIVAFCFVLISSPGSSRDRPFLEEMTYENQFIEEGTPWQEGASSLPPYPQEQDLVAFHVDLPGTPFTYLLDEKHLNVGADGVVRYTLVVRSRNGAWNVSREGMRCDTRDLKIYAYGSGRGVFKAMKNPQWERMNVNDPNRYHMDVRDFYFCQPGQHIPYRVEEIVRRLHAAPRRNEEPGFL